MRSPLQYAVAEDETRVAFHDSGSGDVLLIPGFGPIETIEQTTSFASAARWFGALAEDYRVVRIDLRGIGYSRHDETAVDFSQHAWNQDVTAVIDALEVDEVTLFSVGGLAAYAIAHAADHPDLVRRLVLTNPQDRLVGNQNNEFLVAIQQLARADADLGIAGVVTRLVGREPDREHYVGLVAAELAGMRLHTVADAAMRNIFEVADRLSEVRASTLIIRRTEYESLTPDAERLLASGIEGARYVSMPGDGIFPWTGDIDAVLEVIRSFFRATDS
jgi:pimeloyl-ACP methyl ester carboxylesterase